MNENCVLIAKLIDHYTDLQYILAAQDPVKETEYQLKVIRTKLEAMGVSTAELEIDLSPKTDDSEETEPTSISNKVFNGIIRMILRIVKNALKADDPVSELENLADILRELSDTDKKGGV